MSTIDCNPHKYEGATRDELDSLDRPNCLGTDEAGCVHHHSPYDCRVVVVDAAGDIDHVEDLGARPIDEWVDYVDHERGPWQELNYADTLKEALQNV